METVYRVSSRVDGNNLMVEAVIGGETYDVVIPVGRDNAIVNRRAMYELDSDEAAIDAILKEHATRLLNLPESTHPDPKVARSGGLRKDVAVMKGTPPGGVPARVLRRHPLDQLAEDAEAAKSLDDLKAAVLRFARRK